jgi:anti-sigma B factor antagonist
MEIIVSEHTTRVIVITPQGRVDGFSAPELRKHLTRLVEEGNLRFVLDLSGVKFLDSMGLAVLLSLFKQVRAKPGGDVKLVWPADEGVRNVIRLTKFDHVFDMMESVEAAMKAF